MLRMRTAGILKLLSSMIVVRNSIIPFSGYRATTFWPFIFVHKDTYLDPSTLNHEYIHGRQQLEMLLLPFYIWYCIEYLIRRIKYKSHRCAYRTIGFEAEAYLNEDDDSYLENRKHYSWLKYIND